MPDYIFQAIAGLCVENQWDRAIELIRLVAQWYPPTNAQERKEYDEVLRFLQANKAMANTASLTTKATIGQG